MVPADPQREASTHAEEHRRGPLVPPEPRLTVLPTPRREGSAYGSGGTIVQGFTSSRSHRSMPVPREPRGTVPSPVLGEPASIFLWVATRHGNNIPT